MLSARKGFQSSFWSVSPEYVARRAVRAIRWNRNIVVVPWIARVLWIIQRISPAILDLHAYLTHRRASRRHGPHLANVDAKSPANTPADSPEMA